MPQPKTIETRRMTLDYPDAKDDAAMRQMFSDPETMVFLKNMAKSWQGGWTAEEIVARRERHVKLIEEDAGSTYYIHDKATGELAGVMGANTINRKDRNALVGIILYKKYWSGGYGTETLYELMRGLFEDDKMHKITYETQKHNFGMRRFLEETCGLELEYIQKDQFWCEATKEFGHLYIYSIYEEDWPRIRQVLLDRMAKYNKDTK
ncbi:hypothetical protein BGZ73_007863 [Actinomortierella ambigua]|nr:hypothetical protein BGZ73_007863 [Actinomortierella ambigua]